MLWTFTVKISSEEDSDSAETGSITTLGGIGISKSAKIKGVEQGGKTGTTNSSKDHWFIGISDHISVGLYIGSDEPKSMGDRLFSSSTTIPIYFDFISNIKQKLQNSSFKMPNTVFTVRVDPKTGLYSNHINSIYVTNLNELVFEW